MKAESCREWRESLGAYALGHLSREESAALEAHLEGCPACRAEADSMVSISRLLSHGDPERFGPAPSAPARAGRPGDDRDRRRATDGAAPARPAGSASP